MKHRLLLLCLITILAAFLRLYHIGSNPPGLYIDEVSIGSNAARILSSGKDEHGVSFPLYFRAYGEYKLPVYIYLTSLSEAVFRRTDLAVRLPSAISGIGTVVVLYFLLSSLLALDKNSSALQKKYLPLFSSFLLAVNPWHIQFSRAGFEANMALFFFLSGIWMIVLFLVTTKKKFLLFSGLLLVLTMYTYSTYRIITPLFLAASYLYLWRVQKKKISELLPSGVLLILLCIPLFFFSLSGAGQVRFLQTSAFSEYPVSSTFSMLITYPLVVVKNFITFFSPGFLFSHGDGIGRHQLPGFGLFLRVELPLLVLGILSLFTKKRSLLSWLLLILLLLAPLPAALAKPSPHSLRSLLLVIPLTMLIAQGVVQIVNRKYVMLLFLIFFCFEFTLYLHTYYSHYPKTNSLDWGGGYKDLVLQAKKYGEKGDTLLVDKNLEFAPEYFQFYAPATQYHLVGVGSSELPTFKKGKTIFIRPFYGDKTNKAVVDTIFLPSVNHDVFAQFWQL